MWIYERPFLGNGTKYSVLNLTDYEMDQILCKFCLWSLNGNEMSKLQNLSLGWKVLEVWKVWIHEKHDDITPKETSVVIAKHSDPKERQDCFQSCFQFLSEIFYLIAFLKNIVQDLQSLSNVNSNMFLKGLHLFVLRFLFHMFRFIKFAFDNIFVGPKTSLYVYPYEYVWQVLRNFAVTARQFPNFPPKKLKTQKLILDVLYKKISYWYCFDTAQKSFFIFQRFSFFCISLVIRYLILSLHFSFSIEIRY